MVTTSGGEVGISGGVVALVVVVVSVVICVWGEWARGSLTIREKGAEGRGEIEEGEIRDSKQGSHEHMNVVIEKRENIPGTFHTSNMFARPMFVPLADGFSSSPYFSHHHALVLTISVRGACFVARVRSPLWFINQTNRLRRCWDCCVRRSASSSAKRDASGRAPTPKTTLIGRAPDTPLCKRRRAPSRSVV